MPDVLDRRVLGAVRFLDAATLDKIGEGLRVQSAQADLRVNRSGLWVIWNAAGLEAHTAVFDQPPATPAIGSVVVTLAVADPLARYLARVATLHLPLDPAPANAGKAGSLFQPVEVPLYPSPTARVSPGWAVIRAHVKNAGTGQPLSGALLRVLRVSDSKVLARGVSDARGEALVIVPGIPITTFSGGAGPALATEIDVTLQAMFDSTAGPIGDPDAMEAHAGLPTTSVERKLAAGRELIEDLAIAV